MTQLDLTTFDVSDLVEETLLYFSAMAESCGIRLLSFIDPISTDGIHLLLTIRSHFENSQAHKNTHFFSKDCAQCKAIPTEFNRSFKTLWPMQLNSALSQLRERFSLR